VAITITLDGKKYDVERPRLKCWLELEQLKTMVVSPGQIGAYIKAYLSRIVADTLDFSGIPWYDVMGAYYLCVEISLPSKSFPIITIKQKNTSQKIIWDYVGRTWYVWSHLLASRYGWNLQYISELEIDDAIGLIQEILFEDIEHKEWQYRLSELAYHYDRNSGKATYQPLDIPAWMKPVVPTTTETKYRVPQKFIPVGIVYRESENIKH